MPNNSQQHNILIIKTISIYYYHAQSFNLYLHCLSLRFILFYHQNVSQPQLPPILIINHHAAIRAPHNGRLPIVLFTTAMTPVNEKIRSSTQLLRPNWVQIERTGTLGSLMHYIFAVPQFVSRSREGTNIGQVAFLGWV